MPLLRLIASVCSIVSTLLDSWRQSCIERKAVKVYQHEQKDITQNIIDNIPNELPNRLLDDYKRD